MKDHYDFSTAERGKFYHADAESQFPVYLEPDINDFLTELAAKRKAPSRIWSTNSCARTCKSFAVQATDLKTPCGLNPQGVFHSLDADGQPFQADLRRVATERVIIRFQPMP
jgi:hypothetical protein